MITQYRVDGPPTAPALALSNALGTTMDVWAPQLPALTSYFKVVRYEHAGHSTIEALGEDVLALLDQLGIERASFCGLSLGGIVGMWLATHASDRIDRLVLACTAPHLSPPPLQTLLEDGFTPGFVDAHPDVASLVTNMVSAVDPESYAACSEAIAAMDQRESVRSIVAPTLVLAGAEDPVVPPALALDLQQRIPGSSLVVLPGAAHLANLQQPERFTAAVLDHLIGSADERGMAMRRAVLGDAYVDQATAAATPFTAPFQDFITRYAWGDIWSRPGLDRRTRSAITVAMLVALGRFDELPLHLRGARNNGLTDDEISETLLQSAIYCGVPAANTAFRQASRWREES